MSDENGGTMQEDQSAAKDSIEQPELDSTEKPLDTAAEAAENDIVEDDAAEVAGELAVEEASEDLVESKEPETPELPLEDEVEQLEVSESVISSIIAEAAQEKSDMIDSVDELMTDSAEEAPVEAAPVEEEPDDGRAWYVLHCYSGYENKVSHNLEQRIDSMGMKDSIFDVVVPTEEEIEVKDGKRKTVERRVFPGYILVNMVLSEESWYVVRNTPGVTSFVGQGNEPLPLRPEEVAMIIKRMEADAPRIKVTFKQGERVRIVDGPFNDFRGTVAEIDMERAKVRVMVNFFGRETPVELDFLQVEKA